MAKAVLISIKPKWCELIANGKKTVEIRKTVPKLEKPFKCYIYCTKNMDVNDLPEYHKFCGKVIGEFICDNIKQIDNPYITWLEKASCVDMNIIADYKGDAEYIYGWHISELKIYDKPKEISNYRTPTVIRCKSCENKCICADTENACKIYGIYLRRAPQSWCYVE